VFAAGSQQSRFVDDFGQVGADHPGGRCGDGVQVEVGSEGDVAGVDREDLTATGEGHQPPAPDARLALSASRTGSVVAANAR
jgi:hypothetical protein